MLLKILLRTEAQLTMLSIKNRLRQIKRHLLLIISATFITACGGSGDPNNTNDAGTGSTVNVLARPDNLSMSQDTTQNIAVLSNDRGITGSTVLTIEDAPNNGSAAVLANNTINYTPSKDFTGTDTFSYKISNDGKVSVTTVSVSVACSGCSKDVVINLSWSPSANTSDIGYLVYYGTSKSNINGLAYDLSASTGLDPKNPSISFSAQNDLGLTTGDNICFQISAYTSTAQSTFSDPVCGTI